MTEVLISGLRALIPLYATIVPALAATDGLPDNAWDLLTSYGFPGIALVGWLTGKVVRGKDLDEAKAEIIRLREKLEAVLTTTAADGHRTTEALTRSNEVVANATEVIERAIRDSPIQRRR